MAARTLTPSGSAAVVALSDMWRTQQSLSIMKSLNIEVVPHSRCRKYDLAHSCPAGWVGGSSCWGQPDYLLQAAYYSLLTTHY